MEVGDILSGISRQNQLRPFNPEPTDEFRDEKWFCTKCGDQKWGWTELPDGTYVFMNTACKCQRAVRDAEKAKEAADERKRSFGMDDISINSRFDTDRGWCQKEVVELCKRYADNFAKHKVDGVGLCLYGQVGTGKSFLSYCIANAVADQTYQVVNRIDAEHTVAMPKHYTVYVARPDQAFAEYQRMMDEYWHKMEYTDLVIISDLGREAQNEKINEFLNSWIDWLYEHKVPMVVTTNLSWVTMMEEADKRMPAYDRICCRCYPAEVKPSGSRTARQIERQEKMRQVMI